MTSLTGRQIALVCCLALPLTCAGSARGQAEMDRPYPLVPVVNHPLRVKDVQPDGTIQLEPVATQSMAPNELWAATEGFYLAVSPHFTPFARLSPDGPAA